MKKAVGKAQPPPQEKQFLLLKGTSLYCRMNLLYQIFAPRFCVADRKQASFRFVEVKLHSKRFANQIKACSFATLLGKELTCKQENHLHTAASSSCQTRS